MMRVS